MRYTVGMRTNVVEIPGSGPRAGGVQQRVADNLAAELARKRISGRSAAKDLGVTQMYVARRVSGDVELSVSDLVMFSNYLGLDPSVLLHAEGSPAPNLRPTD